MIKFLSIGFLIFLGFLLYLLVSNAYIWPWERQNAIQTTLKWGGLGTLPEEVQDLRIAAKGSMFTRQFILTYSVSDPEDIVEWIQRSPGLQNLSPIESKAKRHYQVPGRGGALGGTVEIEGKNVRISMSWS